MGRHSLRFPQLALVWNRSGTIGPRAATVHWLEYGRERSTSTGVRARAGLVGSGCGGQGRFRAKAVAPPRWDDESARDSRSGARWLGPGNGVSPTFPSFCPPRIVACPYASRVPSPTPAELQEARRASGNLGGRPRKPTVAEARAAALEELVPAAVKSLRAHLGDGDPAAWQAALRVFEHAYGRPAEIPEEDLETPATIQEVAAMSARERRAVRARLIAEHPELAELVPRADRAG